MRKLAGSAWVIAIAFAAPVHGQTTFVVSQAPVSSQGALSPDGRYVAFDWSHDPLAFSLVHVGLYDRQTGVQEVISKRPDGVLGNGVSQFPAVSSDGRFVAFYSRADNFVPGDVNGFGDVFVKDRLTGTIELVSVTPSGAPGNDAAEYAQPSISADGRFVAFESRASDLVVGDTNGVADAFLRDRQAGTTERVSVGANGAQGNAVSKRPSVSDDGRFVAFHSGASNLVSGDLEGFTDAFVRDRQTGTTERVSVAWWGVGGNGVSTYPRISADGNFVAFSSAAINLVQGDINGKPDMFVRDRVAGTTALVSRSSAGVLANQETSGLPAISADGRFVAFATSANNLVADDTNGVSDIFVRDRQDNLTERVSLAFDGAQSQGGSGQPSISGDGRRVSFSCTGYLVPTLPPGFRVYVRDRGPASAAFCAGDVATDCPCGNTGAPAHGCDNSIATGGARLQATGTASLAQDTLHLVSTGELPSALSLVMQGDAAVGVQSFGDGARCIGGTLLHMYAVAASGGVVDVPRAGMLSLSLRAAALGGVLTAGASRFYQVHYRDPEAGFCPPPAGSSWNASSAIEIVWTY